MSTFLGLYAEVLRRLAENNAPQFWTETELKGYINRGYREFYKRTRYKTVIDILVEAESGRFYIPPNIMNLERVYFNRKPLELRSIEYLEADSSGLGHFSSLVGDGRTFSGDFRESSADDASGVDAWYFEEGRICLFPKPPATAGATGYREKFTGTLSLGTTTITLPSAITPDQKYVDLFLGGVYQNQDQFSVSGSGLVITVNEPAPIDMDYEVVARPSSVGTTTSTKTVKETFSMSAGETTIRLSRGYLTGTNALAISINGVAQASTEWTEVDAYTVLLNSALPSDSQVEVSIYLLLTDNQAEARYLVRPQDMSEDNERPDISPTQFHEALWMWACHEALSREGRGKDIQKSAYYLSRFIDVIGDFNDSFRATPAQYPTMPFIV